MARPFDLSRRLKQRQDEHLYRRRRLLETPQGVRVCVDGRALLNFCSNDYLGLASDERVIEGLQQGAAFWGVGGGASHLVIGHSKVHHLLEEELAEFAGCERALLFSSGWMANLAVVTSMVGRGDCVLEDRLNHASLIDGGLLSGARFRRYHHNDVSHLGSLLEKSRDQRALVVTDGVFSMDGDVAPLPSIANMAKLHEAWVMVDDAHGFGVVGPEGRGSLSLFGLQGQSSHAVVGTLGKAFGTQGAFVAGSDELVETLIQFARPYIYTTSLSPAVAEATRTSLQIVKSDEWRREKLRELVEEFRVGAKVLGLDLLESSTPIQPLIVGSSLAALEWSAALEKAGILVSAIRPPTVPDGTARLRITFSAAHDRNDVRKLLEVLDATRSGVESC